MRAKWESTSYLLLPFFVMLGLPLVALGLNFGLKFKYLYPLVFVWILLHLSDFLRRGSERNRRFYSFLVPAVAWNCVFTWLLLHRLSTPFQIVSQCFLTFAPIMVTHVLLGRRRFREVCVFAALMIVGLAMQSVFMKNIEVGAARALAMGTDGISFESAVAREELSEAGALGYGNVYTMVLFMIGALFAFTKAKTWQKMTIVILWCVYLFGLRQAAYTTALGGLGVGVMFFLLSKMGNVTIHGRGYRRLLMALVVVSVTVVAFPEVLFFLEEPLRAIGGSMSEEYHDYKGRLLSLADAVSGTKDTYAVDRFSLYFLSLKTFFAHPLYGVGNNARRFVGDSLIGGHSTFFDTFASGGIILGGLLVAAMVSFAKYLRATYRMFFAPQVAEYWYTAWYCCACVYVLFSCINTSTSFIISITFLVPVLPFLVTPHRELEWWRQASCYMPMR